MSLVACYKPRRMHKRAETWSEANPDERWHASIFKRDKLSLDLFWIKDKSLSDAVALPAPEVIASEIAEDRSCAGAVQQNRRAARGGRRTRTGGA